MKTKIRIEDYKIEELKRNENQLLLCENRMYKISNLNFEKTIKKNFFGIKYEEDYLTNIIFEVYNFTTKALVEIQDSTFVSSFITFHDLDTLHTEWERFKECMTGFGIKIK